MHEKRRKARKDFVLFVSSRGFGDLDTPPARRESRREPATLEQGYSFEQLSYDTIGACIDVQRQLGLHCMEVDYQRALQLAWPKRGLHYQREIKIPIAYDGVIVTRRRVDFVIWNDEGELLLETKARSAILPEDVEQCLLYLHQGGYRLCLLVNFGEKPLGVRRFVYTPQDQE